VNPGVLGTQGFNTPLEISWSVVEKEKGTKVHVVKFKNKKFQLEGSLSSFVLIVAL